MYGALKVWLAQTTSEHIHESGFSYPKSVLKWAKQGRSVLWIDIRFRALSNRKEYCSFLASTGIIVPMQQAILTNLLYIGWLGHTSKTFKILKNLKSSDILRDNMTPAEVNFLL
jgi:hypothetical protein